MTLIATNPLGTVQEFQVTLDMNYILQRVRSRFPQKSPPKDLYDELIDLISSPNPESKNEEISISVETELRDDETEISIQSEFTEIESSMKIDKFKNWLVNICQRNLLEGLGTVYTNEFFELYRKEIEEKYHVSYVQFYRFIQQTHKPIQAKRVRVGNSAISVLNLNKKNLEGLLKILQN